MSDIYLSLTETPSVVTLSQPVVASVMVNTVTVANVVSVNVVTMPAINVTAAVSGGLTNTELRASAVTVALDAASLAALESVTVTVGNVTIGSSVSISNFPASQTIAGTVTASNLPLVTYDESIESGLVVPVKISGYGQPALPISGTVTVANDISEQFASGAGEGAAPLKAVAVGWVEETESGSNYNFASKNNPFPISGTVTASGTLGPILQGEADSDFSASGGFGRVAVEPVSQDGTSLVNGNALRISGTVTIGNSVTIGSLPRVTFIDGSGSVTTANSAITVFAASTTRSYLLVQVTTGSAFVNVGATATTVNGINLTAGQGYAWETTIPQGAVSLISTTTSSRWVAKEA